MFVLLAIALVGLICIGLLGLGSVLGLSRLTQGPDIAQVTEIPTLPLPTDTPTATATATPTETPLPTPTGTLVVGPTNSPTPGGDRSIPTRTPLPGETPPTPDPNVTPTNTLVVQPTTAGTPEGNGVAQVVPDSGGVLPVSRSLLGWIGGGLLLVLLLYGTHNHFKSH